MRIALVAPFGLARKGHDPRPCAAAGARAGAARPHGRRVCPALRFTGGFRPALGRGISGCNQSRFAAVSARAARRGTSGSAGGCSEPCAPGSRMWRMSSSRRGRRGWLGRCCGRRVGAELWGRGNKHSAVSVSPCPRVSVSSWTPTIGKVPAAGTMTHAPGTRPCNVASSPGRNATASPTPTPGR